MVDSDITFEVDADAVVDKLIERTQQADTTAEFRLSSDAVEEIQSIVEDDLADGYDEFDNQEQVVIAKITAPNVAHVDVEATSQS